jgi:ribosomal protein L11 methylase PrmA
LECNPNEIKSTIIELGCGPGLVAMVASLQNSDYILATDGDPITIDLVKENTLKNNLNLHTHKLFWYV